MADLRNPNRNNWYIYRKGPPLMRLGSLMPRSGALFCPHLQSQAPPNDAIGYNDCVSWCRNSTPVGCAEVLSSGVWPGFKLAWKPLTAS